MTISLAALGVVYGDIGTSPLYTIRECFLGTHPIKLTPDNVLGILSLIFWSLIVVVSIKYLIFVMRADNRGEGGILALMSLVRARAETDERFLLVIVGLFGAALLYGDGMITPAISVLSAVEGLEVATPVFSPFVVPITILILIGLFLVQKKGTRGIGNIFGPFMLIWFAAIAILGITQIVKAPEVLAALNPIHGIRFFLDNGVMGFLALGTVFLAVTGGEALYADMGHFGKKPIRMAWFILVLPALVLNYFGQGALLLHHPQDLSHPFFEMVPSWMLYPMVILATIATTIASQAVISGSFSLTRQAIQLGYSPRLTIEHTSAEEIGQIYVPTVNWILMITTIGLVLGFKNSSSLAAAYGVAVTTTMVITTFLLYFVAREKWNWGPGKALLLMSGFMVIDLAFFGANILKLPHGGWFPLVVAAAVFTLMTTWRRGRQILWDRIKSSALPDALFLKSLDIDPPMRVPGIAIFMDRNPQATPHALLHNIKHNKILHKTVVLLTVMTEERPHVSRKERVKVIPLGKGLFRVIIRYGFMEDPDVPQVLNKVNSEGLQIKPGETTYFLGRESLVATRRPGMAIWREKLFAWMSRNALGAGYFFDLPPDRVIEIGAQVEL